ncbi:MAG: alpha/beta hydrolase family protein [Phycisphaerales bacterium JB050]
MSSVLSYADATLPEPVWSLPGSDGLTLHAKTTHPDDTPRAVALVVHGYTGHLDRNVVPLAARQLASLGCLVHRFNLGHCGIEFGEDRITKLDEFERDGVAHSMFDIRAVGQAVRAGDLPGSDLPMILVGHSRAGASVLGAAVQSVRGAWSKPVDGVITLASIAQYARTNPELLAQVKRDGYLLKPAARAEGGAVRIGRSWYQHELDSPDGDPFPKDMAELTDIPVAVIHGQADTSVPPSESERIVELLRSAGNTRVSFQTIPEADHNFSAKGVLGEDLRWKAEIGDRLKSSIADGLNLILN